MPEFKLAVGLIVSVEPEKVTCELGTVMVRVSPDPSEITILPVPALTVSLNVSTMLLAKAKPVALSAGVLLTRVGASVSTVVKLTVVVLLMPA